MRVALRQEPQETSHGLDAVEPRGAVDQPGGARGGPLDRVVAEMLVQPGPPGGMHRIPRLQHRLHPPRAPAADEAEMAAVSRGHQLDDQAGLAVTAGADDDSLVGPFHGRSLSVCGSIREISWAFGRDIWPIG